MTRALAPPPTPTSTHICAPTRQTGGGGPDAPDLLFLLSDEELVILLSQDATFTLPRLADVSGVRVRRARALVRAERDRARPKSRPPGPHAVAIWRERMIGRMDRDRDLRRAKRARGGGMEAA